jgi:hypothetical protein
METVLVMGVAVALNVIVIKFKIDKERYSDAILDAFVLVLLGFVFMGTVTGLMVGTVASSLVSLYLWFSPPKEYFAPIIKTMKSNFED